MIIPICKTLHGRFIGSFCATNVMLHSKTLLCNVLELSAQLALQHKDVALLSALTTCQDIPIFHWNAHILLETP